MPYKIRRTHIKRSSGVNEHDMFSLTVPSDIAKLVRDIKGTEARFVPVLTDEGILYKLAPSSSEEAPEWLK